MEPGIILEMALQLLVLPGVEPGIIWDGAPVISLTWHGVEPGIILEMALQLLVLPGVEPGIILEMALQLLVLPDVAWSRESS